MLSKRGSEMEKIKTYFLLHAGLFIFSLGFIASKLCSNEAFLSFRYILFFGLQLVTLFVYALIWQRVLKQMPLTIAYANKGITIVWGMLIGLLFFNEKITIYNIIGTIIIAAGTVLTIAGEENHE